MSQSALSRKLALAIGLATKVLPGIKVKQLMDILVDSLGLPLTETKLKSITLKQYQQILTNGLEQSYSQDLLKKSLTCLYANEVPDTEHATSEPVQTYHPGDMPHSIRVAIASKCGLQVDAQFSTGQYYYIYQVSAQEHRLIDIRVADTGQLTKAEHKQRYRAELIQDCQVLYSQAIGAAAASKVIKQGVHPIKLSGLENIADIIEQLQYVLLTSPPPWLAKTMGLSQSLLTDRQQEEIL